MILLQSVNLFDYYGISFPMLIAANDDEAQEVIHCATSGSGVRLLNSLYLEGRILKHELYSSGRFRYSVDRDSVQAKNLVKFVDFYTAYQKNKAEMLKSISGAQSAGETLDNLSGLDEIDSSSNLDSLEMMDTSGGLEDLLAEETDGLEGIDSLGSLDSFETETALEGLDDLDADVAQVNAVDTLDSIIADDEADDVNDRLIAELSVDAAFDRSVADCDYQRVIRSITNWMPKEFKTLRDLNTSAGDSEDFENIVEIANNLRNSIEKLKAEGGPLAELRISTLQADLDAKEEIISKNKNRFEYFDDNLRKVIDREMKNIPTRLSKLCTSVSGQLISMSDLEYSILSKFHECCTSQVNGTNRLDWILGILRSALKAGTNGTRRCLNVEYSVLTSKETRAQLIIFNKRYKEMIRNYSGPDLLRVLDEGIQDCGTLLGGDVSGNTINLKHLFLDAPASGASGERPSLRGESGLSTAVNKIMATPALLNKMQLCREPVSKDMLREMLELFVQSAQIIEIATSDEVFASIYKIWHFFHKNSVDSIFTRFGIFDSVPSETRRKLHSTFGISGFYISSVKFFVEACRVGVNVSAGKEIMIDKNKRKNLYANIKVLNRYLISSKMMHSRAFSIVEF